MAANHTLPDLEALQPSELRALIFAQHTEIHSQREQLLSRDNEIEHLKLLISRLRRVQFGRKSEKLDREIEQLELRLDELEATQATKVVASQTPAVSASAMNVAAKPARRPLPEHLPREIRKYPPKQTACPDCGGELKHLGEDVSEMLEYVPARFKVIRQVRPKLACACCERIVQAEAPSRPIARGIAGPGLLAHVLVSKYCDHLPLYRQSEIYAREGVELERSTLAGWVGGTSALLAPRMTRQFRCWHRATAKPKPAGCGLTYAMIAPRETRHPRRCGSPTRRIAKASIRRRT
jgi:transposase